jgi:hypothetical protein
MEVTFSIFEEVLHINILVYCECETGQVVTEATSSPKWSLWGVYPTAAETHLVVGPEGPARTPGRKAPSWRTRDCTQASRRGKPPCNTAHDCNSTYYMPACGGRLQHDSSSGCFIPPLVHPIAGLEKTLSHSGIKPRFADHSARNFINC